MQETDTNQRILEKIYPVTPEKTDTMIQQGLVPEVVDVSRNGEMPIYIYQSELPDDYELLVSLTGEVVGVSKVR